MVAKKREKESKGKKSKFKADIKCNARFNNTQVEFNPSTRFTLPKYDAENSKKTHS